jgi:DNA (cytosine-5)-methyltransferase 1
VNFYNEFDPKAAAWLREMVRLGELPPGVVDERSIKDLQPHDLDGFTQCHFFAGIGGWSLAARIAGFPADRPFWTGSCPCQPFSVAGKGAGVDDPRHLWPDFLRLIAACRPPLVMGEQVAGAAGYGWLDGVLADLAREGYAGRGVDIPACAVDAPHIRQRLYWIAERSDASGVGLADTGCKPRRGGPGRSEDGRVAANAHGAGQLAGADQPVVQGQSPARKLREHEQDGGFGVRAVAHAGGCGPVGRADEPGGHERDGAAAGRDQGTGRVAERDEGGCGDLVDASRLGRREGLAEPELWCGRPAAPGADVWGQPARFFGNSRSERRGEALGGSGDGRAADFQGAADRPERPYQPDDGEVGFWSAHDWIACHDGKARRIPESSFSLLADGVPNRVAKWRGFGNAIVPQLAAEVIGAYLDVEAGAC